MEHDSPDLNRATSLYYRRDVCVNPLLILAQGEGCFPSGCYNHSTFVRPLIAFQQKLNVVGLEEYPPCPES